MLEDFAPRDRAERTLLKGLLQKPKDISSQAEKQQVSSLASLQDSKEKEGKKSSKK